MLELTPVENHGDIWIKRDDLFEFNGCYGGKVRTCLSIATKAKLKGIRGLVTAASRESPQAKITAAVAAKLGMQSRAHIPTAKVLDSKMIDAQKLGAVLVYQSPGYNTVLKARAREDARTLGWAEVPFGMECLEAVEQNALQTENIPKGVKRIVIPIGSGATVSGVLVGIRRNGFSDLPVLGISVGANPFKMLNTYAPFWQQQLTVVKAKESYHTKVDRVLFNIELDSVYEAKCADYIEPGDLFWIIGRR